MFLDSAVVTFEAGNGGDGCISFRREKYIPKGGPNGGTGGDGGSITLISKSTQNSLIDFKNRLVIRAERGTNGMGSNKTGRNGKDLLIEVPAGTIVKTYPEEEVMFDFYKEDISFVIVKGGKGGLGNSHFKTSINRAPRFAQKGKQGESFKVVLELKLIAFAGLVGFPNAGKSTLISKISSAKPKIADYPFTTLTPHLGVVYQDYESLVVADIPGIIEGAHMGEGMGLDFLKHIERNRVLVFLLDTSGYAEIAPLEALHILREELKSYKAGMLRKKSLIVANKIDTLIESPDYPNAKMNRAHLDELKEYCTQEKLPYIEISALKDINLNHFKAKLFEIYHGRQD